MNGVLSSGSAPRVAWWWRHWSGLPVKRWLIAVAVLLIIIALNHYTPAQPTPLQRVLASLLIGLCAIPSLMWASKKHWSHSLMPYAGVLYAASFALPIFLQPDLVCRWRSETPLECPVEPALLLALGGWAVLMIGHFVVSAGWLAQTLPRIEVAPGDPRFAKMIAAAAACIGVPCFYLDNAAVLAHYAGQALLPDAAAFPVAFAGQAVVFAVLVLFHLHLRSQLGPVGRVCLIVLTAYYTVLGFSTGMANHGLKALFGLFAAYAIAVRRPTWGCMAWGALVAAVLLLVVLPSRYHYRQLVWTHGVEPAGVPGGRGHVLDALQGSAQVVETSAYSATLADGVLTFAHHDGMICKRRGPVIDYFVFVHVYPVDLDDLAYGRRPYGFDQFDFGIKIAEVEDGQCVNRVPLPDYPIQVVRLGLYGFATLPTFKSYLPGRLELTSPASDVVADVDSKGEWHLATRNATTWEIDPSSPAYSRLRVVVADEEERRHMTMIGANNRIRVEIDERNWAEYAVSAPRISGQLATFRLSELRRSQGDPAALADGAAATLRYEQGGEIVGFHRWPGQRPREGTNPTALGASRSLASNTVIYAKSLPFASVGPHLNRRYRKVVERFDRLLPVAWVMANTPDRVPYLRGETLRPLLYKLVPRTVFKDKPGDNLSLIDQRYGFLLPGDPTRHFKVHQLGELYANFGAAGALLGMLVLGLLLGTIHHLFHHASATATTMAAGTHMLTVLLLEMESILSVSWGFVAWYSIALLALAAASRVGRRWFGRPDAGVRGS